MVLILLGGSFSLINRVTTGVDELDGSLMAVFYAPYDVKLRINPHVIGPPIKE